MSVSLLFTFRDLFALASSINECAANHTGLSPLNVILNITLRNP
jgi:hypothetical protein